MNRQPMIMNFKNRFDTKSRAQAITEFALALPLLLLVLYGLLETGRLAFIYASTITAARQAVRYGSVTGVNGSGVPYYQDCDGIRAAAHNVGFINRFSDSDIIISYDRGLESDGTVDQINDADPDPACPIANNLIRNGDRISVQVSTDWVPIVPIVPLEPFTITAESARTILVSVSIQVTAQPSGWTGTGGGELSLDVSASPGTFNTLGQTITYTYTLSNTGTDDLSAAFAVQDSPVASNNCTAVAPATLAAGTSFTCTGTYAITQQDLDDGFVTDVAQASAVNGAVFSALDGVTITANQLPALALAKSGSPSVSSVVGTVITYTYTLTNSGNVTLRSPYTVSDDKTSNENCSAAASPLTPGASTTCTSTYTIKQTDINQGTIINRATATALFGFDTVTSNEATFTVYTPPLYLTITVSESSVYQAGQTITYTYHLYNNTSNNLSAPYTVTDNKVTNIDCGGATSPLAPGATTTCTGTYTVTQADLDAGTIISNTATATAVTSNKKTASFTASSGDKVSESNEANAAISMEQTPALSLQVDADPDIATTLDTVVTYTYTLTNSGNVTLSPTYTVTDDQVSDISCSGPSVSLGPGAVKTCTGTHTITQADLDAGSVINYATASAIFGSQAVTSGGQSVTVITHESPRLSLQKTANFASVNGTGQIITYTYTLRNTGNTPLTAPYTVTDDKITYIDCFLADGTLAVGAFTTCTAVYTTEQADIDAGSVTNQAVATASDGVQTITSNLATATVAVYP
jgi:uncharacterized repeat protein (TIGR01451 family)